MRSTGTNRRRAQPPLPGGNAYIFTVRQLTQYVKALISQDRALQDVSVQGEIGDCTRHVSGHVYCTLKDEHSQLRCVMFRDDARLLDFLPENGLQVMARGTLTVYEPRGQYQLIIRQLQRAGIGDLYLQFERLRAKLAAEGLFEESRKRRPPAFPSRIAVLTSPSGAAVHDILTTLHLRWPSSDVVLIPMPVSGQSSAPGIVHALDLLPAVPRLEVAIVARGGGSMEELSCFNAEEVARAIARAPVPVVTGIGHETDFTIADFVADQRAPTPTGAAAAITPDRRELRRQVQAFRSAAAARLERRVETARRELALLRARPALRQPRLLLAERRQRLDDVSEDLARAAAAFAEARRTRLRRAVEKLAALSPQAVLARGYSVVRLPDGTVVRSTRQLAPGAAAEVLLQHGAAGVQVTELRHEAAADG